MTDTNQDRRQLLHQFASGLVFSMGGFRTETDTGTPPSATELVLKPSDVAWAFDPVSVEMDSSPFLNQLRQHNLIPNEADTAKTAYKSTSCDHGQQLAVSLAVISPVELPSSDAIDEILRQNLDVYAADWPDRLRTNVSERCKGGMTEWCIEITHPQKNAKIHDVYARQRIGDTILLTAGYSDPTALSATRLARRSARILAERRRRKGKPQ